MVIIDFLVIFIAGFKSWCGYVVVCIRTKHYAKHYFIKLHDGALGSFPILHKLCPMQYFTCLAFWYKWILIMFSVWWKTCFLIKEPMNLNVFTNCFCRSLILFSCALSSCHMTHIAIVPICNLDNYLWALRVVNSSLHSLLSLFLYAQNSCHTNIVTWWDQDSSWWRVYGLLFSFWLVTCDVEVFWFV